MRPLSTRRAVLASVSMVVIVALSGCRAPTESASPSSRPTYQEEFDSGNARTPAPSSTRSTAPSSAAAPSSASEYYGEDVHYSACARVGWVGDSLTEGSWGEGIVKRGNGYQTSLPASMGWAGVSFLVSDASRGRAITDRASVRQTTGIEAISQLPTVDCLVVALGTNDLPALTEKIGMTSTQRIAEVNSAAKGKPVFWFPVAIGATVKDKGFTPTAAKRFTRDLRDSGALMIDWDPAASDFAADGIHLTEQAYAARILAAAKALKAFDGDQR